MTLTLIEGARCHANDLAKDDFNRMLIEQMIDELEELESENAELRKVFGMWPEFARRTLEDLPAEIRKDPSTPIYAWGKITEAGCFEIYVGDFERMAAKAQRQGGK